MYIETSYKMPTKKHLQILEELKKYNKNGCGDLYYMDGFKLSGYTFRNKSIRGAKFSHTNIKNVNFHGADLSGTVFQECNLENCNFKRSDLTGVSFIHCNITDTDLTFTDMNDAYLSHTKFLNCNLYGVDSDDASIEGVSYIDCDMQECALTNLEYFKFIDFIRCDLRHFLVSGIDMDMAQIVSCKCDGACFLCDWDNVTVKDTNIHSAKFLPESQKCSEVDTATITNFQKYKSRCPLYGPFAARTEISNRKIDVVVPDDAKRHTSLSGRIYVDKVAHKNDIITSDKYNINNSNGIEIFY